MKAYAIVNIEILDAHLFAQYQARFPALLEQFGGRYIVRGGQAEVWEGRWSPKRLIVIEFPSMEHAQRLAASDVYKELKAIRDQATRTDWITVEGVAPALN
jgi:uncharacterized protein (DUF1330 family)